MSNLADIFTSLEPWKEELISIGLTMLSSYLLWIFRAKVKLTWGSTSTNFHKFRLADDGAPIAIWTEKFFVQNVGKKSALNIELVFSASMTSYNVWPPREHTCVAMENGNFLIKIPSLAASELLIVDMIDIESMNPRLLTVNCPDAIAQEVEFQVNRKFGTLFNMFIGFLMLAGVFSSFYFVVSLFLGLSQ